MRPIEFIFDFISPYAYLAWTQVHALADRHGRQVVATPILFAVFLDTYGHKGPAEIPPKRVYIWKDVLRSAHALHVPLSLPPAHPFNPLLALRCASLLDGAEQKRAIDSLFACVWDGGPGVEDKDAVARALTAAGLDGASLVQRAGTDEAKAKVKQQTQHALAAGAFGVPTMLVDGELFWGLDSFAHAEQRLRGEDPIDHIPPETLARWGALPSTAMRPGSKS
jgi:2-hydroxychromene-2-carboxylate isomerase